MTEPIETHSEKREEKDSFTSDPDAISNHSSINEDAPEEPKFVPLTTGDSKNAIPMILQRRTTLTRAQIETGAAATTKSSEVKKEEHNALLDCTLCKNVMLDPRECHKCRKGFCKQCINEYID